MKWNTHEEDWKFGNWHIGLVLVSKAPLSKYRNAHFSSMLFIVQTQTSDSLDIFQGQWRK